jgi:2-polyprenyl-3-methyl-5-hydroxy-6-metoxy-1,4-benzoquinol methylase
MIRIETERFHPDAFMPPWVRYQHLERYHWAADFVGQRRVLDVACGTGYGTALLANAGAVQVDGFDCCREAVHIAQKTWQLPNTTFSIAAAHHLPVADDLYDIYVSFETIEHVGNDQALLQEATRVLKPDGLLLVSTPNRNLLDPGISISNKPFNRFHIREYLQHEFADRLRPHFASITWYHQRSFSLRYISALTTIGHYWPVLGVRLHQIRKCIGWPWETSQQHRPALCSSEDPTGEVLIAACRSPIAVRHQRCSNKPLNEVFV